MYYVETPAITSIIDVMKTTVWGESGFPARLLGVVEKEDGQFVSSCPQLGVASCGDTLDEALDNLDEALELYLNDLEETGDLERVFQEMGVEVKVGPPSSG